ncbi:hypothetical protein CHS0354_037573 [Potamilus streckersoni]|uniref:Very-long-chain (3R)-3-hydroxyacyl-CoA dehydratase n=1 Tax=Potamilus streckersoni TaxID=2493646 RepID=A0AAE0SVC4_9BIVA|nr:hypothetical protein CHS0354_037573 [Potamilus streckersoni]
MESKSPNKPASQPQKNCVVIYLIAYNVAQVIGWSAILFASISELITYRSYSNLYQSIAPMLYIFQTAAVLEILHSVTGIVRSNPVLTAFQVYSRVFVLWAVLYSVPVVHNAISVVLLVLAWSITEVIRYAFYVFSLVGEVPYVLQWCRYSFFIILYPVGVTGELLSILNGLPYVRSYKLYFLELPNAFNISFNFYYFLIITMLLYIPIFPQLYLHMFAQRKKVVGGDGKPKTD